MIDGLKVEVGSLPSESLLELMWDTFFLQRGRSGDIYQYFPWLAVESQDVYYIELHKGRKLVGGLTVREYSSSCGIYSIGCIGAVCIDAGFRGMRLSHFLLDSVIDIARAKETTALTLWTSKHDVYRKHCFYSYDTSLFGEVLLPLGDDYSFYGPNSLKQVPIGLGMPPFAKNILKLNLEMPVLRL